MGPAPYLHPSCHQQQPSLSWNMKETMSGESQLSDCDSGCDNIADTGISEGGWDGSLAVVGPFPNRRQSTANGSEEGVVSTNMSQHDPHEALTILRHASEAHQPPPPFAGPIPPSLQEAIF